MRYSNHPNIINLRHIIPIFVDGELIIYFVMDSWESDLENVIQDNNSTFTFEHKRRVIY